MKLTKTASGKTTLSISKQEWERIGTAKGWAKAAQAAISHHLDKKPWEVAVSKDSSLPVRKWNHLGTVWAASAKSAAYQARADEKGEIVRTLTLPGDSEAVVFEFPDGSFVRVH
jgi:hypothetical protein